MSFGSKAGRWPLTGRLCSRRNGLVSGFGSEGTLMRAATRGEPDNNSNVCYCANCCAVLIDSYTLAMPIGSSIWRRALRKGGLLPRRIASTMRGSSPQPLPLAVNVTKFVRNGGYQWRHSVFSLRENSSRRNDHRISSSRRNYFEINFGQGKYTYYGWVRAILAATLGKLVMFVLTQKGENASLPQTTATDLTLRS